MATNLKILKSIYLLLYFVKMPRWDMQIAPPQLSWKSRSADFNSWVDPGKFCLFLQYFQRGLKEGINWGAEAQRLRGVGRVKEIFFLWMHEMQAMRPYISLCSTHMYTASSSHVGWRKLSVDSFAMTVRKLCESVRSKFVDHSAPTHQHHPFLIAITLLFLS